MKHTIIYIALILMSCELVHAQDTIYQKDGSYLLVRVIDMNGSSVRYKLWNNQDGPTWVKSFSNLLSVRREKTSRLDFSVCGHGVSKQDCIDGNVIVRHLDSIYQSVTAPFDATGNLNQYLTSLPNCIQKKCIQKYYLEQYYSSIEATVVESVLRHGEIYLMIGGEEDIADVARTVALIRASRKVASPKEEGYANNWIRFLEQYSEDNDNLFEEDIAHIKQEILELLNPCQWENEMRGKWVMLNRVDENNAIETESPFILEIRDVANNAGACMVAPNQNVPKPIGRTNPAAFYNQQLSQSQGIFFNGQEKWATIQFASVKIHDMRSFTEISHTLLDANRDISEELNTLIFNSNLTDKDKILTGLQLKLGSMTVNYLVSNMNNSSKQDEAYNLILYPNTENVMNVLVTHVVATTKIGISGLPTTDYNRFTKDKKSYLVRWEEKDSVMFVSKNGRPITLSSVTEDDPLLDEYNSIKKKSFLLSPAYSLRMLGETALGCYLLHKAYGYAVNMPYGQGEKTSKAVTNTILFMIPGVILTMDGLFSVPLRWNKKKNMAYMEINRKNIAKLRSKVSASLSMTPTYYLENNALGANFNVSF